MKSIPLLVDSNVTKPTKPTPPNRRRKRRFRRRKRRFRHRKRRFRHRKRRFRRRKRRFRSRLGGVGLVGLVAVTLLFRKAVVDFVSFSFSEPSLCPGHQGTL